jgi:acyl-CoA synthetase (NDP forming)
MPSKKRKNKKRIKKKIKKSFSKKKKVVKKKPKPVKLDVNKMDDQKAYDLLKKYKIPLAPYAFCKNEKQLLPAIKKIKFPLAMKVSGKILHKTEVKGVRLDIESEEEAIKTFYELMKIKGAEKVLVQKMLKGGYELIVGAKRDPNFNGIVLLGAGGIFTELLKDVSFRVTPLSKYDAEEMLNEVKFSKLILDGFRGLRPADKESIIDTLLTVSTIIEKNNNIKELDINPLFVTTKKSFAIDVRIVLK